MHKRMITLAVSFVMSSSLFGQSYFPVEKGSEMTYQYTKTFSPQGDAKMVMRIKENEKTIKGQNYLEIKTTVQMSAGSNYSNSSFVRMTEEGWMVLMSESSPKEEMMMPNDFSAGQTWSTSQGKVEVVDLTGSISTPGGDYSDCLVIKTSAGGGSSLSYYRKGVGLVAIGMEQGGKPALMAYLVE